MPGRGSGYLLLVEDEPVIRAALERALSRAGYTVSSCGSVEEAVERYSPQNFD